MKGMSQCKPSKVLAWSFSTGRDGQLILLQYAKLINIVLGKLVNTYFESIPPLEGPYVIPVDDMMLTLLPW